MLCRRFRAYTPWPGIYTHWLGKRLRLLDVEECSPSVAADQLNGGPNQPPEAMVEKNGPGAVGLSRETPGVLVVEAGDDTRLMVRQLQLEGRRPQPAADFLRGHPQFLGARLPS